MPKRYAEMCITLPRLKGTASREAAECLVSLREGGYDAVALCSEVHGDVQPKHACRLRKEEALEGARSVLRSRIGAKAVLGASFPTVHTRLTAVVEGESEAGRLHDRNEALRSYDVVAARPVDDAALRALCRESAVDIIQIDAGSRASLHAAQAAEALARGIVFEVCYAPAIAAGPQGRRKVVQSMTAVAKATRGKGLLVSAGTCDPWSIRGPLDVVGMACGFGVPEKWASRVQREAAAQAIMHGMARRAGPSGMTLEASPAIQRLVDGSATASDAAGGAAGGAAPDRTEASAAEGISAEEAGAGGAEAAAQDEGDGFIGFGDDGGGGRDGGGGGDRAGAKAAAGQPRRSGAFLALLGGKKRAATGKGENRKKRRKGR